MNQYEVMKTVSIAIIVQFQLGVNMSIQAIQ